MERCVLINVKLPADAAAAPGGVWEESIHIPIRERLVSTKTIFPGAQNFSELGKFFFWQCSVGQEQHVFTKCVCGGGRGQEKWFSQEGEHYFRWGKTTVLTQGVKTKIFTFPERSKQWYAKVLDRVGGYGY